MNSVEEREAAILAELTAILREVVNEEWVNELDVTMDSTFSTDLTIESIELVNIAERIRTTYPEADVPGWMAGLDLSEIMDLRVGNLVRYIASCQS